LAPLAQCGMPTGRYGFGIRPARFAWFNADLTSTGGQLLDPLQETYPGRYPDGLLRIVQRRLKIWRREIAAALVFGRAGQDKTPRASLHHEIRY
jgi:hypothetical protein